MVDDRPFVGRARELATAARLQRAAESGRGSVLLVDGPPGMGKTSFAAALSARLRSASWNCVWGSCMEGEGAPAYWPWSQVLRRLGADPDMLTGRDSDADSRFRLFERVIACLREAAAPGLLIVLDDLHYADVPSLRILQILAAEVADQPMIVCGLFRAEDVPWRGETGRHLAAVSRDRATERLTLTGLTDSEIDELTATAVGTAMPTAHRRAVLERAEGNPLFALELLRMPPRPGLAIPWAVEEVIGVRLGTVKDDVRNLLRRAAVLGRSFTAAELAQLTGRSSDGLLADLDAAVAQGLLVEHGSRFSFWHALGQEVAYRELDAGQRRALHASAGTALAAADGYPADLLAHHLREAVPIVEPSAAYTATRDAADVSKRGLAWEQAAFQLRHALALLPQLGRAGSTESRLILELADCEYRAGNLGDAWGACLRAAELARRDADPRTLADAALVVRGMAHLRGDPIAGEIHALAAEALAAIGTSDPIRRAKLLAQLSITTDDTVAGRGTDWGVHALQLAEVVGDVDAQFLAFQARGVELAHPSSVSERLLVADRAVEVGNESRHLDCLSWGYMTQVGALWELGERSRLDAALASLTAVVEQVREPMGLWRLRMIQAGIAELDGRFDRAQELADEGLAIGLRAEHPFADYVHIVLTAAIARMTGVGVDAILDRVREFARLLPVMSIATGAMLAWMGRVDEARDTLPLVAPRLRQMPDTFAEWLLVVTACAEIAIGCRDEPLCRDLYDRLLPYAAHESLGGAHLGSNGPVSGYLGRLAVVTGDTRRAEAHLREAVARSISMMQPTYEAIHLLHLAQVLADQNDRKLEAAANVAACIHLAEKHGMAPIAQAASALANRLPGSRLGPLTGRERELAGLVAEGLSNRGIAERLFLSERTVESHVRNILTKLGFQRRGQIAAWVASQR